MKYSILALALALGVLPIAATAQDTTAPAAPTDQQRQAMRQTFERYAQQEEQLRQQMRLQILSALTPVHRRAVAATIGDLAVDPNPDPQAAARRLEAMLMSGERQRILAAHESFRAQSRQLHEQMRSELQNEMPSGHPPMGGPPNGAPTQHMQPDAGTILLMALEPHPMMGSLGLWPGLMHAGGAPPQ